MKKHSSLLSTSTVKRTSSSERMGTLTRKESTGETKGNRTRSGSTGSNSSGKRTSERLLHWQHICQAPSPGASVSRFCNIAKGMRRVTHCKAQLSGHPALLRLQYAHMSLLIFPPSEALSSDSGLTRKQVFYSVLSDLTILCPPSPPQPPSHLLPTILSDSTTSPTPLEARSMNITPDSKSAPDRVTPKARGGKAAVFSLPLRKSPSQTSYTPLDTPSYKSPIKSPSQYFQICY
ncbi:hypothetical protein JZ751_002664 [Albula glossodonta]|uniref:Uncharacterized protein n=1 Tax=Albula glossodonta TaxID=121402 RepID=A0A8T2NIS3_9TELE|nr:hypothetical protein JZ751_002664 [Albula glossodonta]